jgi:hypothetical protein
MVAAEREACAETVYQHALKNGKKIPATYDRILARTNNDAQAALEDVKQESWKQGYEEGTGEISAAIEEAAAAKRMYRKARNDALREAADVSRKISECCPSCASSEIRILALITEDQSDDR